MNWRDLHGARRVNPDVIHDIDGRAWSRRPADSVKSWRDSKWVTADGHELEWRKASPGDTPDTGWYLYGNGIFGAWMAKHLYEAIFEAGEKINGASR